MLQLTLSALATAETMQLLQVYHELMVLEQMHVRKEYGSGASLQALTALPLQWH